MSQQVEEIVKHMVNDALIFISLLYTDPPRTPLCLVPIQVNYPPLIVSHIFMHESFANSSPMLAPEYLCGRNEQGLKMRCVWLRMIVQNRKDSVWIPAVSMT